MTEDEYWMQQALRAATKAQKLGDVPVGAIVVKDSQCLAESFNASIRTQDPCAHAEVQALRLAAQRTGNYRLEKAWLYVTLEPCMMCAGALIHARVERLIFGAYDKKTGVISTRAQLLSDGLNAGFLNHEIRITGGVLESRCGQQLKDFFRAKRQTKNNVEF